MWERLGFFAAVLMPFWNIPLIIRLEQRKSAGDISLAWVLGVWACIVLMLPAGLQSPDPAYRAFCLVNSVFFTVVVIQVLRYRKTSR